jgi:hypothetical protein
MRTRAKLHRQLLRPEGRGFQRIPMNRFSQLNTKSSLQVTWASDARVALPGGFEVGPFSQLNHANLRPSGQPSPGVLTGVRALISLSGIPAFSQLNANSSLQVTWAADARVALSGFEVGPFSQLNALADWAVLGHQQGGLPAHLFPSLRTKFPVRPRGHEYLNRRPCLHVPDEPRTTRGSVRLEPKILRRSMN